MDHEINEEDIARIEEVATLGKVPANRVVVQVVPHNYRLDGQDNIRDPRGMTGTRLEVSANVVSVMAPHMTSSSKSARNGFCRDLERLYRRHWRLAVRS